MTGQTLHKGQNLWYTDEQFKYAKKCSALEYAQSRGYELIRKCTRGCTLKMKGR